MSIKLKENLFYSVSEHTGPIIVSSQNTKNKINNNESNDKLESSRHFYALTEIQLFNSFDNVYIYQH